ncbi:MAG: hypothetical protein K2N86_03135, partial [Rikenellaceae bacterium]|nr:hypothetical protein [Rikenellaceae bacterium]
IGGTFNDKGELRAFSGGSEFSFVISSSLGSTSTELYIDWDNPLDNWAYVNGNVIVVDPNTTDSERKCRVLVKVDGVTKGHFFIVQGKQLSIEAYPGTEMTEDKDGNKVIRHVGGTTNTFGFSFSGSDDEISELVIKASNSAVSVNDGIVVKPDLNGNSVTASFVPKIDAVKHPNGFSVPVTFEDPSGNVLEQVTFIQEPQPITFDPVKLTVPYAGGPAQVTVFTSKDVAWSCYKMSESKTSDVTVSWIKWSYGKLGGHGDSFKFDVDPNGATSRKAFFRFEANNTFSKWYEVVQVPSFGISSIAPDDSNIPWDSDNKILKAYSKGASYNMTFHTDAPISGDKLITVDCDPDYDHNDITSEKSGITAGTVTADNSTPQTYHFTLNTPDSHEEDETDHNIVVIADNIEIGSFVVRKAKTPRFTGTFEVLYGGVMRDASLKKRGYEASEWDYKSVESSDVSQLPVTYVSAGELSIGFADTLKYDDAPKEATITIKLQGGNSISYKAEQKPVEFTVSDISAIENLPKEGSSNIKLSVGTTEDKPWKIARASSWISTAPAAGGLEINAVGPDNLTISVPANTGVDRKGIIVLESRNSTSQWLTVTQKGSFAATVKSVTYGAGKTAVFADNTLKAFSAAYDYTVTISTSNPIVTNRLSVTAPAMSDVTVKTQPSGTAEATEHTFVLSVPASSLTTEPEGEFAVKLDGASGSTIGTFKVKQAKKPSMTVGGGTGALSIIGCATADECKGAFDASTWDVATTAVTSSGTPGVTLSGNAFTIGFTTANMTQSFSNTSASIYLKGADGTNLITRSVSQDKIKYVFSLTSVTLDAEASKASQNVTVTAENINLSTSTSVVPTLASTTWASATNSGNIVTIKATSDNGNTARSTTFYVTYKGCRSNDVSVTQSPDGPASMPMYGNLVWTTHNLANPRQASGGATFATKLPSECSGVRAESHGKFYQWGINVAWN